MVSPKNKEKIARKTPSLSDWGLRNKKYLLFAGGLNKREGAHYLVEAFKQLEDTAKTPNNFKLAVVDCGEDDSDYVEYLRVISEGRNNILFFCARKGVFIEQLFTHAFLYVQPSEPGTEPRSLLKAMRHGLCALASDTEENKGLLGGRGHVFEARNVVDLRDKLAFLLNKPGEAKRK